MWYCRKCTKPVYFAERKQSLGFDWHPNCLRCEECGKRLNPGQHAEHKGVPFCHHPCYGALFGPQLFGHGTRNECHTSFGKVENRDGQIKRSHLESHLKTYNSFYDGKPGELKSREANGRLILEGVLRIYWGVKNTIHLKEEDDSRMIATRRQSCIENRLNTTYCSDSDDDDPLWRDDSPNRNWNRQTSAPALTTQTTGNSPGEDPQTPQPVLSTKEETNVNSLPTTLPTCPDAVHFRAVDHEGNDLSAPRSPLKHATPTPTSTSTNGLSEHHSTASNNSNNNACHHRQSSGSTAIRRRPGRRMQKSRLKRRCSINGHFYLRETSSFTPPYGSPCSIWITSQTTAEEVLNRLLEKYKVEMSVANFALFVVKDTGELKRLRADESPLVSRVMLGPREEVAKVFVLDAQRTCEVSHEVAQFLNLSLAECRAILMKYEQEEMHHLKAIRRKYDEMRSFIEGKIGKVTTQLTFNDPARLSKVF